MFGMGPSELLIVGIIAVLLFGRRLPEVARSLGTSYREFRKGLNELQSQVNLNELYSSAPPPRRSATSTKRATYGDVDDHTEATAPKFEPPPSEPQPLEAAAAVAASAAVPSADAQAASGDAGAAPGKPTGTTEEASVPVAEAGVAGASGAADQPTTLKFEPLPSELLPPAEGTPAPANQGDQAHSGA